MYWFSHNASFSLTQREIQGNVSHNARFKETCHTMCHPCNTALSSCCTVNLVADWLLRIIACGWICKARGEVEIYTSDFWEIGDTLCYTFPWISHCVTRFLKSRIVWHVSLNLTLCETEWRIMWESTHCVTSFLKSHWVQSAHMCDTRVTHLCHISLKHVSPWNKKHIPLNKYLGVRPKR